MGCLRVGVRWRGRWRCADAPHRVGYGGGDLAEGTASGPTALPRLVQSYPPCAPLHKRTTDDRGVSISTQMRRMTSAGSPPGGAAAS